jgi:hypothetical protein
MCEDLNLICVYDNCNEKVGKRGLQFCTTEHAIEDYFQRLPNDELYSIKKEIEKQLEERKYKIPNSIKITVVQVRDHFSSHIRADKIRCLAEFMGTEVGQDSEYLVLRHVKADIDDFNSAEEYHNILRKAIIFKGSGLIELENMLPT